MESLEFERPVTLIVGHNGAGKTTIIECLKMSTCGQLPPNCDKGHGFIHDPNVAGVPEVKGQIRLLFRTGVDHQHVCATRTFQLTNTRTKAGIKTQFKALENLLRIKDRNGEDNSNSRRCIDMDTAIPSLMGVSRAILEHVIFCHQEESNWPLGERILLKKRFDEIFGSSRYTKALEAIDKRKKETAKEAKDKTHVLELVKKDLDISLVLGAEREKLQIGLAQIEARVSQLGIEVEAKESDLAFLQSLETESRSKILKMQELESEIASLKLSGCESAEMLGALDSRLTELQELQSQQNISLGQSRAELDLLLRQRGEMDVKLRHLRASVSESSNIHELIRLKQSELDSSVAACISAEFLPASFRLGNPAESVQTLESVLHAKVCERAQVESADNLAVSVKQRELQAAESTASACQTNLFQRKSEMAVAETQLKSLQTELLAVENKQAELGNADLDIPRLESELATVRMQKGLSASSSSLQSAITGLAAKLPPKAELEERLLGNKENEPCSDLATAKCALKIYSQMKSKSLAELKCQFCRKSIDDPNPFSDCIDRMTRKLPDMIANFESRNSHSDPSTLMMTLTRQLGKLEGYEDVLLVVKGQVGETESSLSVAETQLSARLSQMQLSVTQGKILVDRRASIQQAVTELSTQILPGLTMVLAESEHSCQMAIEHMTRLKSALQAFVDSRRNDLAILDSSISAMRSGFHQIFNLLAQLESFKLKANQSVDSTELVRLELGETELCGKMEKCMQTIAHLEQTGVDAEIASLQGRLAGRQLMVRLEALKQESANSPVPLSELPSRVASTLLEVRQLRDDRAKLVGEGNQVRIQVDEISRKLAAPTYLQVEERHRQALIQSEACSLVVKDIARYYQALDRALMNYHVGKMDEINGVIRDLWEKVYRGSDIDFIAIRSDTEDENAQCDTTRRSYNYRVVMVKSEVELEMRGRCSAGQKVLASLIIRLALSESFCINCGILALDEPTTNLDRSNIGGLAEALAELIEARRNQRNFQLVVITHDEAFVRMLGRLHASEHFYRVAKDDLGHSTITRSAIYELNA